MKDNYEGPKEMMPQRKAAEQVLGQALEDMGREADKNADYVLQAVNEITSDDKQELVRRWFHHWMRKDGPGRQFLTRIARDIAPGVRERYVARMVTSMFFRDHDLADRVRRDYGFEPPSTMLISPSMRCNYRCQGCYAGSYERRDDMEPEVFERLISEAEALGINFITILGGEPFIYPHLLDVLEKHPDPFYQIYTNGSFIDRPTAERLVEMGNVAPQISINGPRELTEASRGKGSFDTCLQAMENLRNAGAVYGFSSLVTRRNMDIICSDEWLDFLIDNGALYGWLFLFMPVGSDPDLELMPTPAQRDQMRKFQQHIRNNKPLMLVDFWNDGVLTGGCIAGGRLYFHINHRGEVEPCIFCHFATDNIHEKSLVEALNSSFFQGIRAEQPFCYNTLRPCPMIDHPRQMWQIIRKHGAQPTHEGADIMFTQLDPSLTEYAEGVRRVMDTAWETEGYQQWAPEWMCRCGISPEQKERRRREFVQQRRPADNEEEEESNISSFREEAEMVARPYR